MSYTFKYIVRWIVTTVNSKLALYLGISCTSLAALAYEVALTRIFSIALWYHFAFMVVSIAMLGIAASGTFVSIYPEAKRHERLGWHGISLSLAIMLAYILANHVPFDPARLSWDKMQLFYIGLYYLILGVPFFFSGLIILTAVEHMAEKAGRVYFFDLSGAAIGSAAILFMLAALGEEGSVIAASFIALAGGLLFSVNADKKTAIKIIPFIAVSLMLLYIYKPSFFDIRISPYKGMMAALKYPGAEHINTFHSSSGRIDIIKSPAVRYAPGLSFKYLDDLPMQIGMANDGGDLNAITRFEGNKESIRFIDYLPSSIPYAIGKNDDVLIIEPKGGLPILSAVYYSSKNIDKVESNPLIPEVINNAFMDFSGSIYKDNTYTGLGRAFIKTKGSYDIIDISMTGILPWESGAYGLAEDFKLTKEAFMDYYEHLKEGGYLSITMYLLPPARVELRLISTILSAMEGIGIKDGFRHIAGIRTWNTVTILLKKGGLTEADIKGIKVFAEKRRFDLVYYPGIKEEETNIFNKLPDNSYFKTVLGVINPTTRKDTINDYIFDIGGATDEKPFFYHFLKIGNIFQIYKLAGSKWQYFLEEGYLLPIILIQAIIVSILLILLPLIIKKAGHSASRLQAFVYFSSIGLGFMFLEITTIQRFILYLDQPVYAVTIVIAAILFSSGIGSLASQRFSIDKGWKGGVIILLIVIVISYSIFSGYIISFTLGWGFMRRIILSISLLSPMGFLMGMPFPMGIRYLAAKDSRGLIPWAWGVNGSFSVAGSILAAALAVSIGFSGVMYISAALYLFAFLSVGSFNRLCEK